MGLELLHNLVRIVDERKTSALASAILCPETEAGDLVLVGLVEFGEFLTELIFGDIGAVGVEDIALSKGISKFRLLGSIPCSL